MDKITSTQQIPIYSTPQNNKEIYSAVQITPMIKKNYEAIAIGQQTPNLNREAYNNQPLDPQVLCFEDLV